MGKHAQNSGALARAVEWFEEAFVLAGSESNRNIHQDHVAETLAKAVELVK